ncbi:MAG: restriction endonuclease subunit S [Streptococcus suis]
MTRMKDSGIEWIGEVPEDWGIKPIKHIFGAIGSGTTPDSSKVEYYDGNINWLQSGDLYKKDYVYAVSKTITDLGYRSSASLRIYQAPFLAIAMYGASIGNLAISKIDACVNQAVAVLKGEENIVRFAKLALEISKTELIFAAQGGTQPNINQVLIKNWVIPFPSEIEIKKIADFLDKKVAQLDKVKSLLEEQIKTLEDYRQSLIYETVTKGLDKTVPLKDSGVDWIGQIPEGWGVKKHKYIMSKTKTLCSHYSGQKILSLTRQGIITRDVESGKGKMPASFDGYQFLTRGDLLLC